MWTLLKRPKTQRSLTVSPPHLSQEGLGAQVVVHDVGLQVRVIECHAPALNPQLVVTVAHAVQLHVPAADPARDG